MTQKKPTGSARRGSPIPSVQALARQNSIKALRKLIQLIKSESHYVALDAARAVLDRGEGRVAQRAKRRGAPLKRNQRELKVKITRFKEGTDDGK